MSDAAKPSDRRRYRGFETIPLPVVIRVGGVPLSFAQLRELAPGSVLTLETRVGMPFDLLVGGARVARVEPIAAEGDSRVALKLLADEGEEDADGSAP